MSKFLDIEEVVNLLGISSSMVHRNRRAGKYVTQQVKSEGGKDGLKYQIALNSLKKEAQDRYHESCFNEKVESFFAPVSEPLKVTDSSQKTALVLSTNGQKLQVEKRGGRAVVDSGFVSTDLSLFNDEQREIDRAITVIFAFIKGFGGSELAAIRHINMHAVTGDLPAALLHALDNCKEKKRANAPLLTRETLFSWKKRFSTTGSYVPKKRQADMEVKPWYHLAIELYRRPQQPTITYVAERLAEFYVANGITETPPSRGQIERFFKDKMSQVDMQVGKSTGMALRGKRYHAVRSAAGMLPWQEVHADGWATHFTAPHPVTGEYVTLEVWDFHDVATRFVPPFAIGLTENFEVIAKGIENAIREGGVMAILQTDSTKIVKNNARFVGNPLLSISDRAGITIVHPKTVGNAQANGISENFHTWLDKQARELSTYQQKGMDSLSLRRTQKLTAKFVKAKASDDAVAMDGLRKQIAKTSNGVFFESYQQAIDWLEAKRVKWNNHHHSSLPKFRDAETGKLRYQSPAECLESFKAAGWQPVAMDEAHIVDLFRPRVICKVQRGVVKPYGGMRFHHTELPHWEGKQVLVSYDIMDYSAVTVMALDGSLICIAPFCETVAYRAMTAYETAQEKRALAQIKLKKNQIAAIEQRNSLDLSVIEGHSKAVIELKTVDFSRVEPVKELQRVEYAGAEFAAEPKLRTFADMLADEREEDEPVVLELVDYWGTVTAGVDDDTFNVSEEVL